MFKVVKTDLLTLVIRNNKKRNMLEKEAKFFLAISFRLIWDQKQMSERLQNQKI
jgi:hypothetical protein